MSIRLMVVDDSAFMRKIVSDAAAQIQGIEVVGIARNGQDAIDSMSRLKPDIVTMDIEMPKMDGIQALKILKRDYPKVHVIMLSAYSKTGSQVTMEALELGALDFIEKSSEASKSSIEDLKNQLESKLVVAKVLSSKLEERNETTEKISGIPNKNIDAKYSNVEAIAIGASTGGPKVLFDIIRKLPGNLNMPVLIVQHMPKGFTASFAERLDNECSLKVVEAKQNMELRAGTVYVAPGDFHMTIEGNIVKLDQRPKLHGVRPAVDYMFETAAKKYKEKLLAIILTGMGKDGAAGMTLVKDLGGHTMAQDRASCVVYGMPGYAESSGVVDVIMTPAQMTEKIIRISERKNGTGI
ncbi:protein-glutamate methylesterase/protein-glutamine glutaminase [Alkalibacter mobilis]|uniref:protein-glutamate methylesterase/protein-glutamine glutaminase n=1 Tax=Alkalibacter mobilis TaxID=2787712 RepID=UPI00189F1C66|nr:chemotaxis response regulator protein-glutamate methylesterase [Alkalibacter mobilis]MBF7096345.1 chemotaxis response regulator protein-glutamate methylesterase [Alkalibacter mobilis]